MIVDYEAVTVAWLGDDASPVAALATVATDYPKDLGAAFVRVHLVNGQPNSSTVALHHGTGYLQVDCYAGQSGGQEQAHTLCAAVVDRLHAMSGIRTGSVVSAVNGILWRRMPDTGFEPARERYIVEATVHAHPAPA